MKASNYSIVEEYQQKILIPYLNIEIKGWTSFFTGIVGTFTGTFLLGIPLSFFLGSTGYLISFTLSFCVLYAVMKYMNEVNEENGRTKLLEFYYVSIKKYNKIYDSNGEVHYIKPKYKGVIYRACRKNSHLRKHRLS